MKENQFEKSMAQGPKEGRGFEMYDHILGIKKDVLVGKVALDLGAGPNARLSKELAKEGVETTIVSLSPEYTDKKYTSLLKPQWRDLVRTWVGGEKQKNELAVAVVGEQMPFADESFDVILALYSVSVWSREHYTEWAPEIVRVLKKGGVARIGPFQTPNPSHYDDVYAVADQWNKWKKIFAN